MNKFELTVKSFTRYVDEFVRNSKVRRINRTTHRTGISSSISPDEFYNSIDV